MTQIDIKNCTFRICDGTLASLTPASVPANSQLTFTDADPHHGSRASTNPVTVAIIKAGNNTPLSVTVSGQDITINLATDAGGINTSTANQIIAAYNAVPAAKALATIALAGGGNTGAGLTDPAAKAPLAGGPKFIAFKIGDGNFTWDETISMVYMKDRGKLDTVKLGDQMPMDVKFEFAWEFLQAVSGSGTPTVEDALLNRGEASTWKSTATNTCDPYCLDLEIEDDITCNGVTTKEYVVFPLFYFEDIDHDPKTSQVKVSGKCNVLEPTIIEL